MSKYSQKKRVLALHTHCGSEECMKIRDWYTPNQEKMEKNERLVVSLDYAVLKNCTLLCKNLQIVYVHQTF